MLHLAWPGDSIIARGRNGNQAIRNALIAEVIKRTPHAKIPEQLVNLNVAAFAEEKIAPMVRGLFPADEEAVLMEMFSRSIVFLTSDNIASVITKTPFASTAWDLANLYLLSCGAEPLSKEAPELVGLSEETTCYVLRWTPSVGQVAGRVKRDSCPFHDPQPARGLLGLYLTYYLNQ